MNKTLKILVLLVLGAFAMSQDGCKQYLRKDFEFAAQSSLNASEDPSEEVSVDPSTSPSEEGGDEEEEPETDPSEELEEEEPETSENPETTSRELRNTSAVSILQSLKEVEEKGRDSVKNYNNKGNTVSNNNTGTYNWLGDNYSEKEETKKRVPGQDSDYDGYTDILEDDFGTDANDPNSFPNVVVTSLANRLKGIDDDVDGLSNVVEQQQNTNPNIADTDEDGFSDGAELLSNSDPLDNQSVPFDTDGDGLADQYENAIGSNPNSPDSDGDSLRDDLEVAIGSQPNDSDTDKDGVLDGTEVKLGSDPVLPEFAQ